MWYRSRKTNKILYVTAGRIINNALGEGSFEALIEDDILVPVDNPTVIDVLRDTGSTKLATLRYKEIHHCSPREAKAGVRSLKQDMSGRKYEKRGRRNWKKSKEQQNVSH